MQIGMNNQQKMFFLDPDLRLDFQIERWKNSIARWGKYLDHWTENLNGLNEQLKDQCLPEMQTSNIQDDITKAKNNISWAKENIERNQNSINYYQGKPKQPPTDPAAPNKENVIASFKLAAINEITKGKQGETGKPGGLGPIVKSKKCL